MKIRTVYLAGGINGLSDADAKDWREEAKGLLPREIGVLDPMSRDYRGVEDGNVKAIVEGDLADIARCEAIIAYCPRPSWGTAMEIHHAKVVDRYVDKNQLRKIVAVVPVGVPVSPWLRHHTDAVRLTVAGAVDLIVAWSGGS